MTTNDNTNKNMTTNDNTNKNMTTNDNTNKNMTTNDNTNKIMATNDNTNKKMANNDNTNKNRKSSTSLVAGLGSGVITCILCAPLDCIKVRIQVQGSISSLQNRNKYNGIMGSARKIFKEEGYRGFYRGLTPSLLTVPMFGAIYWVSYDYLKQAIEMKYPAIPIEMVHLLSAITAGVVGDVVTNPFFVTRVRMQTMALHTNNNMELQGISTYSMMKNIYIQEGIRAFYKGLLASFLGLSHVAIQFPLYEYLKKSARERQGGIQKEGAFDLIFASLCAKIVAMLVTYPHEVIRSRLQDRQQTNGVVSLVRTMIKNEGLSSLWSGLRVNLIRTFPATISTFLSYEYISRQLEESQ
jgi:solute carrier family 25 folate transporter 32